MSFSSWRPLEAKETWEHNALVLGTFMLYCSTCDQMLPQVTRCEHLWPKWKDVTTGDHVWPDVTYVTKVTRCDQSNIVTKLTRSDQNENILPQVNRDTSLLLGWNTYLKGLRKRQQKLPLGIIEIQKHLIQIQLGYLAMKFSPQMYFVLSSTSFQWCQLRGQNQFKKRHKKRHNQHVLRAILSFWNLALTVVL